MKLKMSVLLFVMSATISGVAMAADSDDATWIGQCVADNKKENATADAKKSYCECMNSKMSDSETQSISTWEESHKKEAEECSAKAGWK
jgi:hypothetical protein